MFISFLNAVTRLVEHGGRQRPRPRRNLRNLREPLMTARRKRPPGRRRTGRLRRGLGGRFGFSISEKRSETMAKKFTT